MNAAYGSSVTLPVSNWTRLLLLAVICCYSLASTTGGFYDEGSSSWSNYDEMWQGDSENATDVDSENATDVTELCRAIIDTNSSNAINSSTNSTTDGNYSGCGTYWRCITHNYITLKTDNITYINARSTIVATVNPNATEGFTKLYYKLCYESMTKFEKSELIRCISNGTTMQSHYKWKESGKAVLTVLVYTSSSYNDSDYLDCGMAKVYVANNYGLNLTLKLINEPSVSNQDLCTANNNNNKCTEVQLAEDGRVEEHFVTGNVTFVPIPRLTSGYYHRVHYYFRYLFNGPGTLLPQEEVCSQQPNLTREYTEVGRYNYTVHAIALVNKVLAHHAKYSGYLNLLEGVSSIVLQVGNNNSIRVGSREEFTVAAEGSTPITVCWYQVELQTKGDGNDDSKPGPPKPPRGVPVSPPKRPKQPPMPRSMTLQQESCVILNNSNSTIFKEYKTFNVVGTFLFVARFFNMASSVRANLTIHVTPGPSPVVVASSATAVVVVGVVITLATVGLILMVGVYVPYKKYKNRMTETADFRFVDLSENANYWDRFKLKSNQFLDYFRRSRHNEKIGLVNMGSVPMEEDRRMFYGTNTLTQFAPYETL